MPVTDYLRRRTRLPVFHEKGALPKARTSHTEPPHLDRGRSIGKRLIFWLGLIVGSTVLLSEAPAQQTPARVALIIGNSNYPDAGSPLPTTSNDARTLADEFRLLNFSVELKENLNKDEMQRAIDAFTGKITKATEALFYFSGFGLQVDRRTYLLPVNAQIWNEADVRRDGISVDALLAEMHRRGAKVTVVIVDAARRNPYERRFRASPAGLAPLDAPEGTLAVFSAAPGVVTRDNDNAKPNSVFVAELVKELRSPNQTAEQAFNLTRIGVSRASNNEMVPWVASSLLEEFYFPPSHQQSAAGQPVQPAPPRPLRRRLRRELLRRRPCNRLRHRRRLHQRLPRLLPHRRVRRTRRRLGEPRPTPFKSSRGARFGIAPLAPKWWRCRPALLRWEGSRRTIVQRIT